MEGPWGRTQVAGNEQAEKSHVNRYGRMTGHASVELAVLRRKMKNEVGKITWVPIAEVT